MQINLHRYSRERDSTPPVLHIVELRDFISYTYCNKMLIKKRFAVVCVVHLLILYILLLQARKFYSCKTLCCVSQFWTFRKCNFFILRCVCFVIQRESLICKCFIVFCQNDTWASLSQRFMMQKNNDSAQC